jgi:NitT/TauT family transport system permease protein
VTEPTATSATRPRANSAPSAQRSPRAILRNLIPPFLLFLVVIGLWTAVSYLLLDPRRRFLLPPPQQVITDGFGNPVTLQEILAALASTAKVAATGLLVAIILGVAIAILMSQASWMERSIYPWAVVLQTIPILALVPLIGFWFKMGFSSRVIVCVLIALFPIITNTLFGLKSADRGHHELFTLNGAGRWRRLFSLQLPTALPATLTGLRISAGLAIIGAIVGDYFFRQGEAGLGRIIDGYTQSLDSPSLFAAVAVSSLLGLAVFGAFGVIAKAVVGPWHESGGER